MIIVKLDFLKFNQVGAFEGKIQPFPLKFICWFSLELDFQELKRL